MNAEPNEWGDPENEAQVLRGEVEAVVGWIWRQDDHLGIEQQQGIRRELVRAHSALESLIGVYTHRFLEREAQG